MHELTFKTKERNDNENHAKQHFNRKRPPICTTEKRIQNQCDVTRKKIVPGLCSYASASNYRKKVLLIGDSLLKRIYRRKFNNLLDNAKSYIKYFPGAKLKELEHYIITHLQNENPDATIIHVGDYNIKYRELRLM